MIAEPARREPFADRPSVGVRGLRTRKRILDAALTAFGESGYHGASLDQVADLAGCSRIAIYQYVSGKEELFRVLASQAATEMWAALESTTAVTPDADGHASVLALVSRFASIEAQYEPVIRTFASAAEDDASLAGEMASMTSRGAALFQTRVSRSDLSPRLLTPTIELLNAVLVSALSRMSILRGAAPDYYTRERAELALADVVHRALFGALPGVNVRGPVAPAAPPVIRLSSDAAAMFGRTGELVGDVAARKKALRSMLEVANRLIAERGNRKLRIEEIVSAANVSRGSFYTHFDDLEDFVRVMGVRAIQEVSAVVAELPATPTRDELAPWLDRYCEVNLAGGPLGRVWIEALEGPLRKDRAAVIDWGRRRMAALLGPSGIGDVEVDAEVLLALVEVFGSTERSKPEFDAVLTVIERGFVGSAQPSDRLSRS